VTWICAMDETALPERTMTPVTHRGSMSSSSVYVAASMPSRVGAHTWVVRSLAVRSGITRLSVPVTTKVSTFAPAASSRRSSLAWRSIPPDPSTVRCMCILKEEECRDEEGYAVYVIYLSLVHED
jgi:hypothetical protein